MQKYGVQQFGYPMGGGGLLNSKKGKLSSTKINIFR